MYMYNTVNQASSSTRATNRDRKRQNRDCWTRQKESIFWQNLAWSDDSTQFNPYAITVIFLCLLPWLLCATSQAQRSSQLGTSTDSLSLSPEWRWGRKGSAGCKNAQTCNKGFLTPTSNRSTLISTSRRPWGLTSTRVLTSNMGISRPTDRATV